MASTIKNLAFSVKSAFKSKDQGEFGFKTAPKGGLFPKTTAPVDGDDCLHDCASCSIHFPAKFDIDESDELYGHVKGWETHLIVATGKTDWVRDVEDEHGSIMEAVGKSKVKPNGVCVRGRHLVLVCATNDISSSRE